MSLMAGAWESQIRFPTWQEYHSHKAHLAIWRSRPSETRLTSDRQLIRKAKGQSDGFGNILRPDARVMAKVMVERAIMELPAEQRASITPSQKWNMVDICVERLTLQA